MKKLNAQIETHRMDDGYVVKIGWGQDYRRKACSHEKIFDEMQKLPKGGNIDILHVPHNTSCIALFEDPSGTGNEKLSVLILYPDPENVGREKESSHVLLTSTEFPSLIQTFGMGWLPFSYTNGNISVKGRDGIKYLSNYPSVGGETREDVRKIDEPKLLLKLACGVIDEKEINKHATKTAVRATIKPVREDEDSEEMKKLKRGIEARDRLLFDVRDKATRRFVGIPLTGDRREFLNVMKVVNTHCMDAEDTRGTNVVDIPVLNPQQSKAIAKSKK